MSYNAKVYAKHKTKQEASFCKLLFTQQQLCDVTLVIGPQKKPFHTHRLLLAAISTEFKALLFGDEEEKKDPPQRLEINDVDPDAFDCVLKYAYFTNPNLKASNVDSVKYICDKFNIKLLSALCDEYVADGVKSARKHVVDTCKKNNDIKARWNEVFKQTNYGKYKTHYIGSEAYHHILDSDGIRQQMPSIIPMDCHLKFTFDGIDMNKYESLMKFKFSELFKVMDDKLYNTEFIIDIKAKSHSFWCKSVGESALDKAMGVGVSDYIMRYRKWIKIHFENDEYLMGLSGENVGIGFCNFTQKGGKKGHQMIQFVEDHMDGVEIEFFGVKECSHISDITLRLVTHRKNKKTESHLFDGIAPPQTQHQVNTTAASYGITRGPTATVADSRYDPRHRPSSYQHINDYNQNTEQFDNELQMNINRNNMPHMNINNAVNHMQNQSIRNYNNEVRHLHDQQNIGYNYQQSINGNNEQNPYGMFRELSPTNHIPLFNPSTSTFGSDPFGPM